MTFIFHFNASISLKNRISLKQFMINLMKKEKTGVQSISFIFCSDAELLEINKTFLAHDYLTDIITFDLSDTPTSPKIAELYISVDRIRDNANIYNTTINKELHRVMFHGLLHLCGYNDKSQNQKKEMTKKEDYYLTLYNI